MPTTERTAMSVDTDTGEVVSATVQAEEYMRGDLTQALLDEIKVLPRPWQALGEQDQAEVIDRIYRRVGENIRQAVSIIASDNRPTLKATVDQVVFKDEVKAVLMVPRHDANRHVLADATGCAVLIVVADASKYMGGNKPKADPAQPDMIAQDVINKASGKK